MMRKIFLLFALFYFSMNLSAMGGDTIMIMSYNIRFAGDESKEGINHWNNRKEFVIKIIRSHHTHIIGVQEALKGQIDDLLEMLPDFSFIGEGRDGGEKGEYSAILFNRKEFDVVESSTFWLSDTPDTISKGWDAQLNRICTWGKFKDKSTGKYFFHFNTHFDHVGEMARQNSSKLLKEKIKIIAQNNPVIITGDLNFKSDSEGYKILVSDEGLKDAQFISSNDHDGPNITFNNFGKSLEPDNKIDFIFVNDRVDVIQHGIDDSKNNGRYPSDHMPVIAEVKLK